MIASISVSVAARSLNKYTKLHSSQLFISFVPDVYSGCPKPDTLSPPFTIDGKTIKLADGKRVRISGVNAFELEDTDIFPSAA